ncbi:MAG: endonuclease NucS [Woeseia sp.]
MAIYDKPTRLLMREMVEGLRLRPGAPVSRQQVVAWFADKYPKLKPGTVTAHLTRMSTNSPSRTHHNVIAGEDDLFFQIDRGTYRLYDSNQDPRPIYECSKNSKFELFGEESETPDYEEGSAEFAYEADLKNYLAKNLSVIEPGLRLFHDDGVKGIEFPAGGRYIDILAVDAENNYVVIELKVSRGYDRVVGQLMRYMAWIATHQAGENQAVRGIIVAREISEDLILASSLISDVSMYEYQLSLDVKKVV